MGIAASAISVILRLLSALLSIVAQLLISCCSGIRLLILSAATENSHILCLRLSAHRLGARKFSVRAAFLAFVTPQVPIPFLPGEAVFFWR